VSTLEISGLRAGIGGQEILRGVDLAVSSGEVHAVMGPNGSGKSTLGHVLMGMPGYTVLGGEVTLDGQDVLAMAPHERAEAGLFLAMQYPVEVPGVALEDMLLEALVGDRHDRSEVHALLTSEAQRLGLSDEFVARPLNVDLSGGEKKRNETLQMVVLRPAIAVLDEVDSGLDVDALKIVAERIEEATKEWNCGVLAITHYRRLLQYLHADRVHVLSKGRIVESGGPDLADHLEETGYAAYAEEEGAADGRAGRPPADEDPFADPLA